MFILGIIAESLESAEVLASIKSCLYSQRKEHVPTDENPLWHVNEYHVSDREMERLLPILANNVKCNYYIHAFNDEILIVILKNNFFRISREKDCTWDKMIEYGVSVGVERHYLESVPLSV